MANILCWHYEREWEELDFHPIQYLDIDLISFICRTSEFKDKKSIFYVVRFKDGVHAYITSSQFNDLLKYYEFKGNLKKMENYYVK